MNMCNFKNEELEQQLLEIKRAIDDTKNVLSPVRTNIDSLHLAKAWKNHKKNIGLVLSSVQEIYDPYRDLFVMLMESMMPCLTIAKQLSEIIAPVREALQSFEKFALHYTVIKKLGDYQLIWFDKLSVEAFADVLSDDCSDTIITAYLEKTNYKEINKIIDESSRSLFLSEKKVLYHQSMQAYQNSFYELSCIGLVSIIDFLMAKISGDISTKSKKHIESIISKMETNDVLDSFEFSLFATFLSFESVITSLFTHSDFSKDEPQILNRHWIIHGRTQKDYQKLDCVKLINVIYALLIIGSL